MFERYWIGVVSQNHVQRGVSGGFAQLCHGKSAPLKRMKPNDWLIYYSPKTEMNAGKPLQMFTAIGQVLSDTPYPFAMSESFVPYRHDIDYKPSHSALIQPLIPQLSFIKDPNHWGYPFRFGHFEINHADFLVISQTMGVHDEQ